MVSDYVYRAHSLTRLRALIDQDRTAAAALAEASFHNEVHAAISSITGINAVALAKVSADTQVASAKMLIEAEVASAHLAAGAQMAVIEYKRFVEAQSPAVPLETVAAMVRQIGDGHLESLSQQAAQSVKAIESESQTAIARLKQIATAAIDEIRKLADAVSSNVESDAAVAADELQAYRRNEHTIEQSADEADRAAQKIEGAAILATGLLRNTVEVAVEKISATTEESTRAIEVSIMAATERITAAKEKALVSVRSLVQFHMP